MAQIAKVDVLVQTKCCATKFYDLFKYNMHKLVDILPKQFQNVELVEGEEGCAGNVKLVKYNLGGPKTAKIKFAAMDDAEKSIETVVLEGDVVQQFKSFKVTISAVNGNTVKWSIEFEKANESSPEPNNYVLLFTQITNTFDAHFVN